MKVVLVGDHFGWGGGTRGQLTLAAAGLAERGLDVEVRVASADHAAPARVRLLVLGRAPGPRDVPVHGLSMCWVRVPGATVFRAGGGAHAAWLQHRGGAWRRLLPRERQELSRERACGRRARRVVVNSSAALQDVVRHGVADQEQVVCIRNGVDLERFTPERRGAIDLPRSPGRTVLFCSNGFRRKGLDLAVEAFARTLGAHDRLWVAGHDAHAARWRRRASRRLGERLVWLGAGWDPAALLPHADVLLHPTRYDASANVVLEALACGTPAVTTSRDGAAEVVPEPSWVAAGPDVTSVAVALGYAASVGRSARWRDAAEHWPGSRMVDDLYVLLTECLDGRSA